MTILVWPLSLYDYYGLALWVYMIILVWPFEFIWIFWFGPLSLYSPQLFVFPIFDYEGSWERVLYTKLEIDVDINMECIMFGCNNTYISNIV